jgi:hypothetical protein
VSSAPRLASSSLNWTPLTLKAPTPLTLAVTDTVLLMVEPEAGDVMATVTIRPPPNCARAGCGAIKLQPTIANRTATRAILLFIFTPDQ